MTEQPEERILERVRKLLDRANHPGTPEPERDACIAKADGLMFKHAIDQAMLDANAKSDMRTPVSVTFRAYSESEFKYKFQTMMSNLATTVRCRVALKWNGDVIVVGMADDVEFYEMVWTTIYLSFTSKINPKWNDDLSFDHNVYNFKKAGYKWPEICSKARANNHHVPWPDGGALIRAYKRHAKLAGDTHQVTTQRHAAYRESFTEGFVREICAKLEQMREDQSEVSRTGQPGTELALRGVQDRVDEAFYEAFPNLRPMSDEEAERIRRDRAEAKRREQEELEAKLAAMTPAQRRAWDREQEAERRREERENARYWRQYQREQDRLYDSDGIKAGRQAGAETDLSGGRGHVGSATRKELG